VSDSARLTKILWTTEDFFVTVKLNFSFNAEKFTLSGALLEKRSHERLEVRK